MTQLKFFLLSLIFITACAQTETQRLGSYAMHGIDVSKHQGQIDWQKIAAQDIHFAYIKATEGRTHRDTFYTQNWEGAKKAKIRRGAYHFYRPSVSAKEQAQNFINRVELSYGDLPPVLDIEIDDNLPRETIIEGMREWIRLVEIRYAARPIIYTNYKFYNKFVAGEFDRYPIWIAQYGDEVPRLGGNKQWIFWQYGNMGKLQGIKGTVDFNVFHGSKEDLEKLCLSRAMLSGIF